jgi:hypothetical protein
MNRFTILFSFLFFFAFAAPASAQMQVTPTVYCLGSCPTAEPTQSEISPTGISSGSNPATSPHPSNPLSTITDPTINTPCEENSDASIMHDKKHKKSAGGFWEMFMKFLLMLIELFLGGGGNLPIPGTPQPTGGPAPTDTPQPTTIPCPDPTTGQPTSAPSTTTAPTASAATPTLFNQPTVAPTVPVGGGTGVTGQLRVSSNGRYLVRPDGSPFYWLGDTAWNIFGRLTREDMNLYLSTRKNQGFTVIQMVVLKPSSKGKNIYGVNAFNGNVGSPNPAYFDHVDYAINEATKQGLYVALWPIWSKDQHGLISAGNAEGYGKFLGTRYKDKPIIWVFGGDDGDTRPDVWRAMAKGLAIGMTGTEDYSKMLMTYHPVGQKTSSSTFHNDPWLDFNMVQSGHDSSQKKPYEMLAPDYAKTPVKPVVDSEAMYEKHSDGWSDPNKIVSTELARSYVYWGAFSSIMGHSYGHWYIWPFVDAQNIHPYSSIAKLRGDWKKDYLNDVLAGQVKHLRNLMESRPWHTGVPDSGIITSGAGSGTSRKLGIKAADGSFIMVYTPNGGMSVNLSGLSGNALKAWWFDPRTGQATDAGAPQKGTVQFNPPGGGDWILVVDDASKNFPAPGTR